MEDYDIYNEMKEKSKKIILIIEDDENFVKDLLKNSNYEIMPLRESYDLSSFTSDYIKKTKELFTFYYNKSNNYKNELLRLKKHFIHYQRKPSIAYIPNNNDYLDLKKMLNELNIKCISNKNIFLKSPKIIFIDNDGTLKRTNGMISERTKQVIKEHQKLGNKIIITTSRPRYQTVEVMKDAGADEIVISSNGAEIYDNKNKNVLFNNFIDTKEVLYLVEYAYLKNIRLILTTENFEYVTKDVRNPKQKLLNPNNYINILLQENIKQCMFIDKNELALNKIKNKILKSKKICIVDEDNINKLDSERWFSIGSLNSSKGNALKFLSNYFNISIENTIAIGNDKNDLSMLQEAGLSVVVSNATSNIKKNADYVTLSNDDDGVAIFLESLLEIF